MKARITVSRAQYSIPVTPRPGVHLGSLQSDRPERRGHISTAGLVIVSLVMIGSSVVAGGFLVHTVSAALFGGGQDEMRTGFAVTAAGQQSGLKLQNRIVERRRTAVAEFAATLAEFKSATARPPSAVGINLNAAEVRRRNDALTGLVLECINAVDRYNLAATALSVTQLRVAGLPERFAWEVDCAPGN